MNAGVASRGSPTPRSMISMPRAAAACLAWVSRTNGYVPCASRSGFTRSSATQALQQLVAAHERGDVDLLVAPVRERGVAGPEVHGVDARADELGHRGPGLLRQHVGALRAQRVDERVRDRHGPGGGVAVDHELAVRLAE